MANRAVLEDEKRFFEIVQTTPDFIEARSMIDDALEAVKMEIAISQDRLQGKTRAVRVTMLGALQDRIKSERHRIQCIDDQITWQQTVKAVCGKDLYEQCIAYIQMTKSECMGK